MGRVDSGLSMARGKSEQERKEAEETIARGQTLEKINVRNEYFILGKIHISDNCNYLRTPANGY